MTKNIITKEGKMICPRCEEVQNLLSYTRLQQSVDYRDSTVPLYKCPQCRFVFGPRPDIINVTII